MLDDETRHTFSFFLNADPAGFYAALERRHVHAAPRESPAPNGAQEPRPFPKRRRTVWYWLMLVFTLALVALMLHDLVDIVRRW